MKLFGTISEEEKLVKGCVKGRPEAQEALYNRYYRTMFGVCLRYAKDRETAEDVLQEGFIKVFTYIHTYTGNGSLEGWIRRIIVNTALEQYRKKGAMYAMVDLEKAYHHDAGEDIVGQLNEKELLGLIQNLPDGYRTIFNLYAIEGYNHREIGELLGIAEGTSKSQFARARQTLQENIYQMTGETYGKAK